LYLIQQRLRVFKSSEPQYCLCLIQQFLHRPTVTCIDTVTSLSWASSFLPAALSIVVLLLSSGLFSVSYLFLKWVC
jgi:hypothetical protein